MSPSLAVLPALFPTAFLALFLALLIAPLVPGLLWSLAALGDAQAWRAVWQDTQVAAAWRPTLVSAWGGTALATWLAAAIATRLYPWGGWQRLQGRLPALLATPHAAYAIGLAFLLAPTGWIARLLAAPLGWSAPPGWVTVQDPYGLTLGLALALKECWFLLWALAATLGKADIARQITVARSLGYARGRIWASVIWPQVLPRMAWPLAAVLAYSVSVVDVALILGPGNPPTLAALAGQWLVDADPARQAQGLVLSALLFVLIILTWGVLRACVDLGGRLRRYPGGARGGRGMQGAQGRMGPHGAHTGLPRPAPALLAASVVGIGYLCFGLLLAWSVAGPWFFPAAAPDELTLSHWRGAAWQPLGVSLALGLGSCALCLPLALAWLEWGPSRFTPWLYAPLLLPAMPLAAAQYFSLLQLGLDGTWAGVIWSHALWVLPYMVLALAGPYAAFDARYLVTARALGLGRLRACLQVKWPLLLRPILAAAALGFSVSIAQYLPTLYAGGGRFASVTTEAVALSAQGHRSTLAVQAMLQILLPLGAFVLAARLPRALHRHRLGMH